MKRLIEQTACEEHGLFGTHTSPKYPPTGSGRPITYRDCPGGSSREVIVDYEAAWRQYREWSSTFWDLSAGEFKAIIDAALNGGSE